MGNQEAFLAGVGKAQTRLGLSFTDSTGKMLSMPAILQKIYDKYGMIDTTAKSDALQKAFGTKEASSLIKLLIFLNTEIYPTAFFFSQK